MSPPPTARTTSDALEASFVAAPGEVIAGRYELLALLGRGAAGSVWEAKHRVLSSRVALKLLDAHVGRSEAEAAELLERFRFEAQISARLGTTVRNVVAVHDAGAHEGLPFLAMELVRGESIEDQLLRGSFDPLQVASVVADVAEALDGLHANGIAHRDLKPANVLCLGGEGPSPRATYKLADFGVAKMFGEALTELVQPKQTATNMLVGTPAYMSPEYLAGGGSVDGSGDLWALAVVAYELWTGRLPFDGANWTAVAVAISRGEFEPPSKLLGKPTPAIDGFFARALAARPEHRFASAGDLSRAFVEALAHDTAPSPASPSPSTDRLQERAGRAPSTLPDASATPPRGATPGRGRDLLEPARPTPEGERRRGLLPVFLLLSLVAVVALGLAVLARRGPASSEGRASFDALGPDASPDARDDAERGSPEREPPPPDVAAPEETGEALPAPPQSTPRGEAPRVAATARFEPAPRPSLEPAPSPSVEPSTTAAKRPPRALPKEEVF